MYVSLWSSDLVFCVCVCLVFLGGGGGGEEAISWLRRCFRCFCFRHQRVSGQSLCGHLDLFQHARQLQVHLSCWILRQRNAGQSLREYKWVFQFFVFFLDFHHAFSLAPANQHLQLKRDIWTNSHDVWSHVSPSAFYGTSTCQLAALAEWYNTIMCLLPLSKTINYNGQQQDIVPGWIIYSPLRFRPLQWTCFPISRLAPYSSKALEIWHVSWRLVKVI